MIKYLLVNFLKNLGLFQLVTVSAYKQIPLIYLSDTPQKVDIISIEKCFAYLAFRPSVKVANLAVMLPIAVYAILLVCYCQSSLVSNPIYYLIDGMHRLVSTVN